MKSRSFYKGPRKSIKAKCEFTRTDKKRKKEKKKKKKKKKKITCFTALATSQILIISWSRCFQQCPQTSRLGSDNHPPMLPSVSVISPFSTVDKINHTQYITVRPNIIVYDAMYIPNILYCHTEIFEIHSTKISLKTSNRTY